MKKLYPLLISIFISFACHAQENVRPKPLNDEFQIKLYIDGLHKKSDVERITKILNHTEQVRYFEVVDFPQQYSILIAKKTFTPEQLNKAISVFGYSSDLKSFLDPYEVEQNLYLHQNKRGK